MKSVKPKLSVIVPVYNAQNYIADCLNSLISQEAPDVEIICIDDCSSDFTNIVLKKYLTLDSRLRVFRQYNEGVSSARNRGILEARGEYICFVDADDCLKQGFFKTILHIIHKQVPDLIIYGGSTFPKKVLWAETNLHPKKRIYLKDCWRVLFDEYASSPFVFNKVFRKDLLLNNVSFDKNIKIGEVETQAGVSVGYLSRIVKDNSGSNLPLLDVIMAFSEKLGVSMDSLLTVDFSKLSANEEYLSNFCYAILAKTKSRKISNKND